MIRLEDIFIIDFGDYKKKEKMTKIINKKGEDDEIEFERKCSFFEDSIETAIENNVT